MPKNKPLTEKEKGLKKFIKLTWEVVRRNPEYRENYVRFLNNEGLSPEDVKPKKREDGSSIIPWHPARHRQADFDNEKGRFVWEEEAPDPQRCNKAYMMQRWGFACDPDTPIPQGAYWCGPFISKNWLDMRKLSGPIFSQPLMTEKFELQKLPGVLEVNRWPEFWLNDENKRKLQEAGRAVMAGWKPKNRQELQEYKEAINPRQWEIEAPPCLTVTINLQAPSQHIHYALEFLVKVCKAELGIKGKVIEEKHIIKCLEIYDLHQEGCSEEDIADKIDLTHYKEEEAMRYGVDEYLRDWGVPQVKRCLEGAEEMIKRGSII